MVKVAENKIVDLDVFPDERVQELARKARSVGPFGHRLFDDFYPLP